MRPVWRQAYAQRARRLGLAFRTLFFVAIDEILTPLLGLSPGPGAYSWKVHARGAAAHIGYGVAAETAVRVVERVEPARKSAA